MARAVKRPEQAADDGKAAGLPEMHSRFVGADHEVELHGAKAARFCMIERMQTHSTRDAEFARFNCRDIAAIGDMASAATRVVAKIIGAAHHTIDFGHEHLMARLMEMGERSVARHVARQGIGFALADHRLNHAPDRAVIAARRGANQYGSVHRRIQSSACSKA